MSKFKETLENDNFEYCFLKDLTCSIKDGVHNTVQDDLLGDCFLLSCKNLKNGQLSLGANERKINRETFLKLRARTKISPGDILLSSVGTIGETYLVQSKLDNIEFQRSVAIIKPDLNKISSEYLYLAMQYSKNEIVNAAHGAVQQCLFLNDIQNINIPLAGPQSISILSKSIKPLLKKIYMNCIENEVLTQQRDTLLPKLMSGEIDVSSLGESQLNNHLS